MLIIRSDYSSVEVSETQVIIMCKKWFKEVNYVTAIIFIFNSAGFKVASYITPTEVHSKLFVTNY